MSEFIEICRSDVESIGLARRRATARALDGLVPDPDVVAINGASCAGKTTLCEILSHDSRVVVVPERYTELSRQGRLLPFPDRGTREEQDWCWIRNQFLVAVDQIEAEQAAVSDSVNRGKLIIIDRSLADAAVYMPGGFPQLLELLETSEGAILGRYRSIIQLGKPSEEVYLRVHHRNTARNPPDYSLLGERERVSREICSRHPRYRFVEDQPWIDKLQRALSLIQGYLT